MYCSSTKSYILVKWLVSLGQQTKKGDQKRNNLSGSLAARERMSILGVALVAIILMAMPAKRLAPIITPKSLRFLQKSFLKESGTIYGLDIMKGMRFQGVTWDSPSISPGFISQAFIGFVFYFASFQFFPDLALSLFSCILDILLIYYISGGKCKGDSQIWLLLAFLWGCSGGSLGLRVQGRSGLNRRSTISCSVTIYSCR